MKIPNQVLRNDEGDVVGCMSVNIPTGASERGGGGRCGIGSQSVDSLLGELDYEDMLREVSKLPPSERAAALKALKRKRRMRV